MYGCLYHSVRTILSVPFCPIPFLPVTLRSSPCCAFSLSFFYLSFIIQSISFCLGLPLPLFTSIIPSIISLCKSVALRMCPIQFVSLVLIISMKDLFLPPFTSLFVLRSVQLILSILLHIHILYYNYNVIITTLTARGAARGRHFCKGICTDAPWCGSATSQATCVFYRFHDNYSSTDISSTTLRLQTFRLLT